MNKAVILLIFLLLPLAFAKTFSLDPCSEPTTITQDSTNIYMESGCYKINFTKTYNGTPIQFLDKYNNDSFDLKLFSLFDFNTANTNQRQTISFEDLGMNAQIEQDKVKFVSPDGRITLTYEIQYKSVKAGIAITNWTSNYATGNLTLRTRIHKEDTPNSHFLNLPAIVDGIEQPLSVTQETAGENQFFLQSLFVGNHFDNLLIDPLYVVDYSPVPAIHLIKGITETDSDSSFYQIPDIHTGLSDNSTNTTYIIHRSALRTQENFETGNLVGGIDWLGNWVANSGCAVNNINAPIGTFHLRGYDDGTDCNAYRVVNLSPYSNVILNFSAKASELEAGEYCYYDYYNGTAYIRLMNFTDGTDTNVYGNYSFNITPYGLSQNSQIRMLTSVGSTSDYCYIDNINMTTTKGNAVMGRWNITHDPAFNWFVELYKTTSGSQQISIFAYNNSDIISTLSVTQTLIGTGWFDINVSSLLDYEKNTKALTYTQLRVTSLQHVNISELLLRQEVNDSLSPNISGCYVSPSNIGCLESLEFDCSVSDNVRIISVIFTINNMNYTAEQHTHPDNTTHYELLVSPNFNTSLTTYNLTNVFATDLAGLVSTNATNLHGNFSCIFEEYINIEHTPVVDVTAITNISATIGWTTSNLSDSYVEYGLSPDNLNESLYSPTHTLIHTLGLTSLLPLTTYFYNITSSVNPTMEIGTFNFTTLTACIANWLENTPSCQINDSYFRTYYDSNACNTTSGLPFDNGTWQYCNYCSEDLEKDYVSTCYLLNGSGVLNIQYHDNNFYSCCAITNLVTDCSIYSYPYNTTTTENCTILTEQFEVNYDDSCNMGIGFDKCYWTIDLNRTNSTFNCITYIKTSESKLIQSMPQYTKKSDAILQLKGTDYEDRTYFSIQNGIGSVYFTKENLIFDGREYIFGVKCADNDEVLTTEKLIRIGYENLNSPITRLPYLGENASAIVAIIIGLVIVMILAFWIWRLSK
jgi:hypothetical protein